MTTEWFFFAIQYLPHVAQILSETLRFAGVWLRIATEKNSEKPTTNTTIVMVVVNGGNQQLNISRET